MNEKQKQRWAKTRLKGRKEFILRDGGVMFGILCFGLILPVVNLVYRFIINNFTFSFIDRDFLPSIIFGLILSFPVGCLFGWLVWEVSEWQYKRLNKLSE